MTPRMNANLMKVLFVIVILTVMLLQSLFTQARPEPGKKEKLKSDTPAARAVNLKD